MGRKALLDAWSLVLQGREDEVLPVHGVETDPMTTLGAHPTEPYQHADKQFSTWQMIIFGRRTKVESSNHGENGADTPFVSEGDVMCAWWTRQILSCVPKYPSQTIAINIAFGLRWLLAKDMLPASSACVANAVMYVLAFMPAKEVLNRPLGYVAAALRKALAELGTREQVEAHLALDRTSREKIGNAGLFGDPWMHMVVCTNWTKGNFYDVDFSAAVVKEGRHLGAIWEGTRWRGHPMFNSMPLQSASR